MLATYRPREVDREVAPGSGRVAAAGDGDPSRSRARGTLRTGALFRLSFALISALVMLWPAIDPGLKTFYQRTIAYQAGRESPFSIWGQVPGLEPLRIALLVASGLLGAIGRRSSRRKTLIQVAALGAALLIALQLTLHHWFYLYIVWFYPLLLLAFAGVRTCSIDSAEPSGATSTNAPITQTSSSAVSNLTGI